MQKCAYNEATFRVPDKAGWQPNQALIFDEDDLGHRLSTDIDVDRLAGKKGVVTCCCSKKSRSHPRLEVF
jgi:hypothetical protein